MGTATIPRIPPCPSLLRLTNFCLLRASLALRYWFTERSPGCALTSRQVSQLSWRLWRHIELLAAHRVAAHASGVAEIRRVERALATDRTVRGLGVTVALPIRWAVYTERDKLDCRVLIWGPIQRASRGVALKLGATWRLIRGAEFGAGCRCQCSRRCFIASPRGSIMVGRRLLWLES
jgi:hypothetical protein